jgi:hypothetical protein
LQTLSSNGVGVAVQVDETRTDDQAADIENRGAAGNR